MHKLNQNNHDPALLAIQALAWALGDDSRAQRLLSLTGLTPEGLRAGIGEAGLQAAVLGFLESHEPDLLACAIAIDVSPAALVAARRQLDGAELYD
ncbi:DUF3572 domain-containing protein [Sphingorhabdus arenilitoris]|uniref:DUF3572 domain-containing protein n=1 Tax=Sphingorhabdus arenilitoris TaxID=1490041 RepID=A0ABV8RKA8_9SPHN